MKREARGIHNIFPFRMPEFEHFPQHGRIRSVVCSQRSLRYDGWNECGVYAVS